MTYADPDSDVEASADLDASGDAPPSIDDASSDGPAPEAAPNTCPDQVPSYATVCCGPIPCNGANCIATCTDCAKCSPLDLCCPNAQNKAVCKPSLRCF